MASDGERLAEALRLLQAGEHERALAAAQALRSSVSVGARAHMIVGMVRRGQGRHEEALAAFERAQRSAPDDYAIAFERALALQAAGALGKARESFEHAARLRTGFTAAHRGIAQCAIALGDFGHAERAYAAALAAAPDDAELPMLLAQVRLLLDRLDTAWRAYAHRPQRRAYEAHFAAQGARYEVPAPERIARKRVAILGEQGLGDQLFFLRYAAHVKRLAAEVTFVGDPRLHPLLARTGLIDELASDREAFALGDARPILLGDLPSLDAQTRSAHPASITIPPQPAVLQRMRARMEATGPRPWIGVTWRAGVPSEVMARALHKHVPLEKLFAALRESDGTFFALQRQPHAGEMHAATDAAGRVVNDFSGVNDDLEEALATVALLDRHVAVSNTNVHLAAAAGQPVDVLVPYPPEWRWGLGPATPWFPAMRVLRQAPDGDWSQALQQLAR
jgi:hypothetical protein